MRSVYYRSEDEGHAGRLVWAFAGSIAVNEIILGIIAAFSLFRQPAPPPDTATSSVMVVVIRPTPTPMPTPPPTPVPTPAVTPKPRIAETTQKLNQARPKAAATPAQHEGGEAAPNPPVLATNPPVKVPTTSPRQIAVAAPRHVQVGNGTGQAGASAGTGGGPHAGNGGANGSDSGTGGNGNQNGVDAPLSPCGQAWFDLIKTYPNDDGSVYVKVSMRVMLRDGEWISEPLHWYFYYPHAADNPFLPEHSHDKVSLQFPPSGFNLSSQQAAAIAMAIRHTRANGSSSLPDCPTAPVSQRS